MWVNAVQAVVCSVHLMGSRQCAALPIWLSQAVLHGARLWQGREAVQQPISVNGSWDINQGLRVALLLDLPLLNHSGSLQSWLIT